MNQATEDSAPCPDPAPAEGALVTLDKPGGERVELTAGADGTVVFDAIDWTLGAAAATASMDGHGMASHVGLTEADSPLTIRIPVQPVEWFELSGSVTNMTDEANWLSITAVVPGSSVFMATGSDYAVMVPAGAPFGLAAWEFAWDASTADLGGTETALNWSWQEMDAITADTTNDITFEGDGGVETETASGSFNIDLTEGTPLSGSEGWGGAWVGAAWDGCGDWVGGVSTYSASINAEGTAFDYTLEYMNVPSIPHYVTNYSIYSGFIFSMVRMDGLPTEGSHATDFLDVPVLPSLPAGGYELNGAPFTWESAETNARPVLTVTTPDYTLTPMGLVGEYTWTIQGPVGATSLAIPVLPEGGPLTEQIETGDHVGMLTLMRDAADSTPGLWLGALCGTQVFDVQYTP